MDGRNRYPLGRPQPPPPPPHHVLIEEAHHSLHRSHFPPSQRPHPAAALMEDRIVAQHREIQTLLLDNQRLGATHVALKQELSAVQQEFRHMSSAASRIKAERDAQIRELYERSLKLEEEVRSINELNAELVQVREDIQKLRAAKVEMNAQSQAVNGDLARARLELQQVAAVKEEIEIMHKELDRGRAAIEYEKKTHAENLEHARSMEKSMVVLAREIEKLRAELANAEKRARAAAAVAAAANPAANPVPGYAGNYGNPEMGYGGNFYADPYSMPQVHDGADGGSQYGPGAVLHGPYDMQRAHMHK